jgi:hypothetical protein
MVPVCVREVRKMTVRDLLKAEMDIDVYDDVCEELSIAFCGPMELTEDGEDEFGEVLDYTVEINPISYGGYPAAIVLIDDPDEAVWTERLEKAKRFFESAAGYCASSDYDRWFKYE